METSTHYELNLYEGSDTFNPLVVDVPNFETIDEAMYENYLKGNGSATELFDGVSVHAITRADETAVFHFTATANWTAGDTITVDGTQVTVKLANGKALGTGAYVINSEVLCILNGTLLTVYVPEGTAITAENALKLGGELPEYYGTATAVQNAQTVAQAAATLVDALEGEVSDLSADLSELIITRTYIASLGEKVSGETGYSDLSSIIQTPQGYIPIADHITLNRIAVVKGNLNVRLHYSSEVNNTTWYLSYRAFANIGRDDTTMTITVTYRKNI